MRPSPTRPTRNPVLALLEGEHAWGTLEQSRGHDGVARYRLVVHPPGLDRRDRIALRLSRTFTIWGLGLWILLEVSLMAVLSPWVAVAVATGACLAVGAALAVLAGAARGGVRTLSVATRDGSSDADVERLKALANRLVEADAALARGASNAVEHEAEVWRVYDALPRS